MDILDNTSKAFPKDMEAMVLVHGVKKAQGFWSSVM